MSESSTEAVVTKKFELSPSIAILVSGVLIAAAIVFVNLHPTQPVEANPQQLPAANVPAPKANEHIIGSATAPIVLIEYSDFQCPYCQMIYPTLKKIVSESNGQIAWVMRNYPLVSIHPQAKPAALAAECVAEQLGNDGFWKYADIIFANQSKLSTAYYAEVAKGLGVNEAAFTSCVASEKYAAKLDSESAEAEGSGGNGTPFTVVAGKNIQAPVSGALPYAQIMSVINAVKARQ
jgi:protein-disulfide isomerase